MTVSVTGLPETLPEASTIDAAARDIRSVGTSTDAIRDEIQFGWNALSAVFKSPHQDRVFTAVAKVMGPYVNATASLTDGAAAALEAFADEMTTLRPRFENIRSRAVSHNAVPFIDQDAEYWQDNGRVQHEVNSVAGLYDAAVDRCASALRNLNPSMPGAIETAGTVAGKVGDADTLLTAAGLGASHFTFRGGKLFFSSWGCPRAILSAFMQVKGRSLSTCRTTPRRPCSGTCPPPRHLVNSSTVTPG